jgi:hypothetical protein
MTDLTVSEVQSRIQSKVILSALDALTLVMEVVERQKGLKGTAKALVVLETLKDPRILEILPGPVAQAIVVMAEQNLILPSIDAICAASRGQLGINHVATCCTSFWTHFSNARMGHKE